MIKTQKVSETAKVVDKNEAKKAAIELPENIPLTQDFAQAWEACKTFLTTKFQNNNLQTSLNIAEVTLQPDAIVVGYVQDVLRKLLEEDIYGEYLVAYLKKALSISSIKLTLEKRALKEEEVVLKNDFDKLKQLEEINPAFIQLRQFLGLEIDY